MKWNNFPFIPNLLMLPLIILLHPVVLIFRHCRCNDVPKKSFHTSFLCQHFDLICFHWQLLNFVLLCCLPILPYYFLTIVILILSYSYWILIINYKLFDYKFYWSSWQLFFFHWFLFYRICDFTLAL